jgi:hypothetical protein
LLLRCDVIDVAMRGCSQEMRAGEEVTMYTCGQRRSKRKCLGATGRKVGSKFKHLKCEYVIRDNLNI